MKLACLPILLAASGVAHADDDDPVTLTQLPAPKPPEVAPKLTIVAPAMDATLPGKRTRAPDDKFTNLDCLQDAKTFVIKVAATNWAVKPGGPGVLIVVDGVYATVTYDLTKPVKVADLEPYERPTDGGSWATLGPMATCGLHWVAVMPTTADGHMLRVAPVVSWWKNTMAGNEKNEVDEDDGHREGRLARALPIVNWPLLGSLYIGTGWNGNEDEQRSGRVLADPNHAIVDWATARGTDSSCAFEIAAQSSMQSWNHKTAIPPAGTAALPASFVGQALVFTSECRGGLTYYAKLWGKKPPAIEAHTWPSPGSAEAEDYWHSAEGHAQFRQNVRLQREKCDNGEGNCQYGHTKPKTKPRR